MRLLTVSIFVVVLGLCSGRELIRQKRDDIFGGLGKILNQFLGNNGGGNNGGDNNGPPPNPNKQGPLSPTGKANYCEQNAADCEYLNCLAENFQHSENTNNLKMGGKILTDPQLRKALKSDPTVSQAACDKIGLDSQGCDGFKSFLGLIDQVSPSDNGDPRDPNRGKRGAGLGVNANVGVGGGHGTTPKPNQPNGNGPNSNSGRTNGPGGNQGGGNKAPSSGPSKSSKGGHGSVDYSDYYDGGPSHGGHGGGGSGGGAGTGTGAGAGAGAGAAGGGDGAPAYVQKDCNALLHGGNPNANGNGNGNGRGTNGGNNRGTGPNGGNNRGNTKAPRGPNRGNNRGN